MMPARLNSKIAVRLADNRQTNVSCTHLKFCSKKYFKRFKRGSSVTTPANAGYSRINVA